MKVIFIGYVVPKQMEEYLSGISIAGNKMQLGLINSLAESSPNYSLHLFTLLPMATYPKDKCIYYHGANLAISDKVTTSSINYINIPIIKQLSQIISMFIHVNKIAKSGDKILTFNNFPQVGIPALWIKKTKNVQLISLLADLPIDDTENRNFLSKFLRKIFDLGTLFSIKQFDKIICLNELAAKKYAPNSKFISIEGGIYSDETNRFCSTTKNKLNIVYTGALTAYSGIRELIKSIELLDNQTSVLEIYGKGELSDEIIKIASTNKRIIFYGNLQHEEIKKIQSNAYLLVNPRPINDLISSVTFPSKIFEYMLSSTPVLSTRLNCLNKNYDDKIFLCDYDDANSLAKSIDQILLMDINELRAKAKNAYLYVATQKNWIEHAKKINSFMIND